MVKIEKIRQLSRQIAQEFNPERIILFGSYAIGSPGEDSDVDLLVVMPFDGKPARKAFEILKLVNPLFPVDLIVRTPKQVKQRLEWNDFFLRDIFQNGKILYEASHS
jgi:predicted nucleotidyltransferase